MALAISSGGEQFYISQTQFSIQFIWSSPIGIQPSTLRLNKPVLQKHKLLSRAAAEKVMVLPFIFLSHVLVM